MIYVALYIIVGLYLAFVALKESEIYFDGYRLKDLHVKIIFAFAWLPIMLILLYYKISERNR